MASINRNGFNKKGMASTKRNAFLKEMNFTRMDGFH